MYQSLKEMSDATKAGAVTADTIDQLAWTAVFGKDAELRGTARWIVRSLAAAAGIRPASIHDLYMAMGRGDAAGFTVPAINVRSMAYDTARAVVRSAKKLGAGAFIFEIARSEIGYTEQRPHEYAAVVIAAALREGFSGPIFIQGDHVQTNAKKYNSPDRDKELDALRALIKEEIAAGFYNIDIDTSTLVDLDKPTLAEQQEVNVTLAADFAAFIRKNEPQGVTVSVGGEIGEVGGKNSDVHELHAYMDGFNTKLKERGASFLGLSKISVQTGTAHGGFVNADGTVRTDVKIDVKTLEELSDAARKDYGMGGAVQHGASTLPLEAFDAFPRARACEIHLATDFQNMVRAPAVPGRTQSGDVRVGPRERRRGAQAERHRGAVHLQGAQEGHRPVQAADVEHQRRPPPRHRPVARRALHVPHAPVEDRGHRERDRAPREGPAGAARSRRGNRRGRRHDHRRGEKSRRPGGLSRLRA